MLAVAFYLADEAERERRGPLLQLMTNGELLSVCYLTTSAAERLLRSIGRYVREVVIDGNCLPHSLATWFNYVRMNNPDAVRLDHLVSPLTTRSVRLRTTSFVEHGDFDTTGSHTLRDRLSTPAQRAAWVSTYRKNREFSYPPFALAFVQLLGRPVTLIVWVGDGAAGITPLRFPASGEGEPLELELVFVNHNHWMPVFKM